MSELGSSLNGLFFMNYALDFFKTGNKYIDSLLICIIFSCMPIVVRYIKRKNFKKYLNKLYYTFFYKGCYIELTSVKQYTHCIRVRSSEKYNAVLFYIINILKCENIRFLKENQASYKNRFGQMFKNYDDEEEQFNKFPFEIKTPNGKIYIENNIYFEFEENESETSNGDRKVKMIETTMRLLSDNKKIFHIKQFIEKCVKIYDKELYNYQQNKLKLQVFSYKSGSNSELKCNETVMNTECENFEDSIFDNKNIIFDELKRFTYDKFYKKHPEIIRKFVGLFYGKPGTGKTNICYLIAKYLHRHILTLKLSDIKTKDNLNSVLFFNKINTYKLTPKDVIIVLDDIDGKHKLVKGDNNNII